MRNRRLLPENRRESPNASLGLCIRDPTNYQQRTDPDKGNENFVIAPEEDLKSMTPQNVGRRKRRVGLTPHAQRQRSDWYRESQNASLRLSIRDPTRTTLRTATELHKHKKRLSPTRNHSIHTEECPVMFVNVRDRHHRGRHMRIQLKPSRSEMLALTEMPSETGTITR